MSPDLVSPPLKLAVLGTGRIGSVFAFRLAQAGHDVTVIARPGSIRLQQLRRDDGILDVGGERAGVRVMEALDEDAAYDLLIVTVLDHQVDAVLPSLQRSAAGCVQFMFNTFRPERLRNAIGAGRCAFGMPFVQGLLNDAGHLKARVGAGGQKTLLSEQRWVELFNMAGLPAMCEPDMPLWLRCHVPLCVAFESVSVAGQRRGGGASWSKAMMLARGMQAGFGLIRELGDPVYPKSKRRLAACPAAVLAGMLWSLSRIPSFRELLASGEAECRALVDDMIAAAPAGWHPEEVHRISVMTP